MSDFDAIIVGSGPAGVSAAFPLVQAGLKVLMVDGGRKSSVRKPVDTFLRERENDSRQWEWMVGEHYHALNMRDAISPKLRVPTHAHVFEGFREVNKVDTDGFIALGSLAPGGLSNAWGCGVAQLHGHELAQFPFAPDDLTSSYRRIVERIGVSGPGQDDLSGYFGMSGTMQPEIALDDMHTALRQRYAEKRHALNAEGFRLGRFPVAALSQNVGARQACNRSGNCLYGCERGALYSATDDLKALQSFAQFHTEALAVDSVLQQDGVWQVRGIDPNDGSTRSFSASRVFLAAGTIASTRLGLQAVQHHGPVRLLSCPTAAFILWLPAFLGARRADAFGYGQLAFVQELDADVRALGSTFSTLGLPMTEFARHLPLRRRYAVDVLRGLMSSCVVGNLFLPGHLSRNQARLDQNGRLHITGAHDDSVSGLLATAAKRLRKAYGRLGGRMLPMSFTPGSPGGDIHYAGTLPMQAQPAVGSTRPNGELAGAPGLYVVDGASLPVLTEKSHTLTIMANADRIAAAAAAAACTV